MNQFFVLIVHFHVKEYHKKFFLFYDILHYLTVDYIFLQDFYMLVEVHQNFEPKIQK
jgi:hypothetical protein